jgi:biotin carboxyl carrier protein
VNKYQYTVKGVDYEVEIAEVENGVAKVNVNGIPFEVELKQPLRPTSSLNRTKVTPPPTTSAAATTQAAAPQNNARVKPAADVPGFQQKSPLPGTITEIRCQVGQHVEAGQTIMVLEAMKMQNSIEAEQTGNVTAIAVKQGANVMEGDLLLIIG